MKCEICGAELDPVTLRCAACGAKYTRVCLSCGRAMAAGEAKCAECSGEGLPGLDMTREEMLAEGIRCFIPYLNERDYRIWFGGNRDGGGGDFQNVRGYTRVPPRERVVLPALVEGLPIYGVWTEFFCIGAEFAPDRREAVYARMAPIREIVLSNGIREVFTYSFFGCVGLELLELPRSLIAMKNDFYDLFLDGEEPMGNGVKKSPLTIRYRGTAEEWGRVAVTSRFEEYVRKGCIRMEYLG